MLKRGWLWTVLAGILPIGVSAATSVLPSPNRVGYLGLAVVLAVGHFLLAVGYDDLADRSGGGDARSFLQVGGLGLLLAGGIQIWGGALGDRPAGDEAMNQMLLAQVGAVGLIVVSTVGAAAVMLKAWPVVAVPLLASGVLLALVEFGGKLPWGLPESTTRLAGNLAYVVLGLAMLSRRR